MELDEYLSRAFPVQRLFQLLRDESEVEALLERTRRCAAEALREHSA